AALAEALRAARVSGDSGDTMRLPAAAAPAATAPGWREGRSAAPTMKAKARGKGGLVIAAALGIVALLAVGAWRAVDPRAWWDRGGAPSPGPEPTPNPDPARAALVLPLPDKLRKDFGLKVTMLAGDPDGKNMRPVEAGPDGVYRVGLRQKVQFQI